MRLPAAHGLDVDTVYSREYPVTINAEPEAAFAGETVAALFGPAGSSRWQAHYGRGGLLPHHRLGAWRDDLPRGSAARRGLHHHALLPLPVRHVRWRVLSAGGALYAWLTMRRLAEASPITTASPRGME